MSRMARGPLVASVSASVPYQPPSASVLRSRRSPLCASDRCPRGRRRIRKSRFDQGHQVRGASLGAAVQAYMGERKHCRRRPCPFSYSVMPLVFLCRAPPVSKHTPCLIRVIFDGSDRPSAVDEAGALAARPTACYEREVSVMRSAPMSPEAPWCRVAGSGRLSGALSEAHVVGG